MRKFLLLGIGAASLLLFTGNAFGAVAGGPHDLSPTGGNAKQDGVLTMDRICAFCHTPHGARTDVDIPLWNRTNADISGYIVYDSATLDAVITPAQMGAGVTGACLSCHDGNTALDSLFNFPRGFTDANIEWTDASVVAGTTTEALASGVGKLGPDFSTSHPVAFRYDAAQVLDGELVAAVGSPKTVGVLPLFVRGGDDDWLECASCHDVHDDTNIPFLRISNAGSALCLECHVK